MKKSIAILIFLIIISKVHGQPAPVIQAGSEQFKELTAQNKGVVRFSKNGSASRNELTTVFDQTLLNLSGSLVVEEKK